MFSVVIPLYNKEKYISRTVQSVLSQTFQDFEIIIVDDGSTDGSMDEVKTFNDPRIRIIHQKNTGVSAARNKGIEEAKYELIAFLDADDEWQPDYLATISYLIREYPNCDIFATSYLIQSVNGSFPVRFKGLPFDSEDGILYNYFEVATNNMPPLWTSAICVKKCAIQEIGGFPEGIKSGEDLLTWARLAIKHDVAFSKKALSIYHNEVQNWEAGRPTSEIDYVGTQLKSMLDCIEPNMRKSFKHYIAHWYSMRASTFLRHNRRMEAFKDSLKAISLRSYFPKVLVFMIMTILPFRLNQYIFKHRSK